MASFTRQQLIDRKALQDQWLDNKAIDTQVPATTPAIQEPVSPTPPAPWVPTRTEIQAAREAHRLNIPLTSDTPVPWIALPPTPAPIVAAAPAPALVKEVKEEVTVVAPKTADEIFTAKVSWEKIDFTWAAGQTAKKRFLTAKASQFSDATQLAKDFKAWLLTEQNIRDIEAFNPEAVAAFKTLKADQDKLSSINKEGADEDLVATTDDTIKWFEQKFKDLSKWQEELLLKKKELLWTPEIKASKLVVNESVDKLNSVRLKQQQLEDNIRDQFSGKATEWFINAKIRKEGRLLRQEEQELLNEVTFEQSNLKVLLDSAETEFDDLVNIAALEAKTLAWEFDRAIKLEDRDIAQQSREQAKYTTLLSTWWLDWLSSEELIEMDIKSWFPEWTWEKIRALAITDRVRWTKLADLELQTAQNEVNKLLDQKTSKDFDEAVDTVRNPWDFIRSKEWFRSQAYDDATWLTLKPWEIPKGTATIWYWFTQIGENPVQAWDSITQQAADKEFGKQLRTYENFKDKVTITLTPTQEEALRSFEYNLGRNIWKESTANNASEVIKLVNLWKFKEAWNYMKLFNRAWWKVVKWLQNRRNDEAQLLMVTWDREWTQSSFQRFKEQAIEDWLDWEAAIKFAEKRYEDTFSKLTWEQGKSFNAYTIMQKENELFDSLVSWEADTEDFANAINFISTQIKDETSPLTAEIVNRATSNPTTRRAIMSEMRWLEWVLREESWAAISIWEYLTKWRSNFPRAWDDSWAISDKERARKDATIGKFVKMWPSGQRQWEEAFWEDKRSIVSKWKYTNATKGRWQQTN